MAGGPTSLPTVAANDGSPSPTRRGPSGPGGRFRIVAPFLVVVLRLSGSKPEKRPASVFSVSWNSSVMMRRRVGVVDEVVVEEPLARRERLADCGTFSKIGSCWSSTYLMTAPRKTMSLPERSGA